MVYCSHYKVVVVKGDLSVDTTDIPDEDLLPYDTAMNRGLNYYVAIASTVANSSHTLGSDMKTTDTNGIEYSNKPLRGGQHYRAFVRIYSKHVCYILLASIKCMHIWSL